MAHQDGSQITHAGERAAIGISAIVAFAILTTVSLAAGAAGTVSAICDREKLPGRGYVECLEAALRDSDRALAEANQRAQSRVEARTDLAITQRTRWKNVLEEAQGQFIRFRNFDCQNVAPYEGTSGRIGAFNERLACLIEKNLARTQELLRRYGNE
jgi:uncharacterized protein YecT (DUF1311 family)